MTNLKLVLRTYSALRQMSPDDIALLETLRALNDGDRELMVETLQGKATARKVGKKSSKSSSKSPRASGMAAQLKERRLEQREPVTTRDDDYSGGIVLCSASLASSGLNCNLPQGHALHVDKGYVDYHPFRPSTTAPPAPVSSPANGGVGSTTANSGTLTDDTGTVAHGASGGD